MNAWRAVTVPGGSGEQEASDAIGRFQRWVVVEATPVPGTLQCQHGERTQRGGEPRAHPEDKGAAGWLQTSDRPGSPRLPSSPHTLQDGFSHLQVARTNSVSCALRGL